MTRELLEELYARVSELETIIAKELDKEMSDPETQVYGEARLGPCSAHAFEEDDERMKVIGQNGNDGLHYEDRSTYLHDKVNWANKEAIQKSQQTNTLYPGDIEVTYTQVDGK